MAHRKRLNPLPVPPENQPLGGQTPGTDKKFEEVPPPGAAAPFNEQDPQRRLGNYQTAGEHAVQQPGGRMNAQRNSRPE